MKIGCSGQVSERSGIGVVQRHLYGHLEAAGHDLVFSQPRDVGTSVAARARGLVHGLRPAAGSFDVYLSTVPPLPLTVDCPLLTVVYDLRWLRTRSKLGTAYRGWDLRRTVRSSEALICISEKTRQDLTEFVPAAGGKAKSCLLGPGHIPENSFIESDSGLLMMVGGAPHKRNEHAASALALARPRWVSGVIGVGVSDQVKDTLGSLYHCEWFERISDAQMLMLYQRAQYFIMLGTDEGFGLPFVEALVTGCQVIATEHPLAHEVLGDCGRLIAPGDTADIAAQLIDRPDVPLEIRRHHARAFSWSLFGEACEAELVRIAESRR